MRTTAPTSRPTTTSPPWRATSTSTACGRGEETVLKVSEGRSILIKFVGMSDPDKDGYRTLTFEVNGILREQKVLDKTLEVLEDRKLKADKNNPCHLGSTIPGTVETVLVKEGDEVKVNQPLMIVEAMKMETTFVSKVNGKVDKLYVAPRRPGEHRGPADLLRPGRGRGEVSSHPLPSTQEQTAPRLFRGGGALRWERIFDGRNHGLALDTRLGELPAKAAQEERQRGDQLNP